MRLPNPYTTLAAAAARAAARETLTPGEHSETPTGTEGVVVVTDEDVAGTPRRGVFGVSKLGEPEFTFSAE
jgi:hypothetical protein